VSRSERATRAALRTMLVPTDFSRGAELALKRALLLPRVPDAAIHVVHVLPPDLPVKRRAGVESEARTRLDRMLARARRRKAAAGVRLTAELLAGQPFVEIIRASRRRDVDLIVVGRHGRRPIRDMFIGTTAERVVRKGDVPVLVVNLEPTGPYRRPVLAVDLEDSSRRTVELALRVLGPEPRHVDVVHGFHVPFSGFIAARLPSGEASEWTRAHRAPAEKGLTRFLAPYLDTGVRWKMVVRHGDPRSVVLATATRRNADLIAVGTHGRSGVAHALIGSVAEWILDAAACDVLVARPIRFCFELP